MDLVQGFQGHHFVLGIQGGFGGDSKGFRGVHGGFVGFTYEENPRHNEFRLGGNTLNIILRRVERIKSAWRGKRCILEFYKAKGSRLLQATPSDKDICNWLGRVGWVALDGLVWLGCCVVGWVGLVALVGNPTNPIN